MPWYFESLDAKSGQGFIQFRKNDDDDGISSDSDYYYSAPPEFIPISGLSASTALAANRGTFQRRLYSPDGDYEIGFPTLEAATAFLRRAYLSGGGGPTGYDTGGSPISPPETPSPSFEDLSPEYELIESFSERIGEFSQKSSSLSQEPNSQITQSDSSLPPNAAKLHHNFWLLNEDKFTNNWRDLAEIALKAIAVHQWENWLAQRRPLPHTLNLGLANAIASPLGYLFKITIPNSRSYSRTDPLFPSLRIYDLTRHRSQSYLIARWRAPFPAVAWRRVSDTAFSKASLQSAILQSRLDPIDALAALPMPFRGSHSFDNAENPSLMTFMTQTLANPDLIEFEPMGIALLVMIAAYLNANETEASPAKTDFDRNLSWEETLGRKTMTWLSKNLPDHVFAPEIEKMVLDAASIKLTRKK